MEVVYEKFPFFYEIEMGSFVRMEWKWSADIPIYLRFFIAFLKYSSGIII